MDIVEQALVLATEVHKGQFRKDGKTPYINHPIEVAKLYKHYYQDTPETQAIALLHDVLEDTKASKSDMYLRIQDEFGMFVVTGVNQLTRYNESKIEYYKRLGNTGFDHVKGIKLCDRLANLRDSWFDLQNNHNVDEDFIRYYIRDTFNLLEYGKFNLKHNQIGTYIYNTIITLAKEVY